MNIFNTTAPPSIDRVLSTFHSQLTELDAFIAQRNSDAKAHAEAIIQSEISLSSAIADASKAEKVRANIEKLIEEHNG